MKTIPEPLSVYIHIPFCASKCAYCDFLSFADLTEEHRRYAAALEGEIAAAPGRLSEYAVKTVFFGGGTPTVLSPKALGGVLNAVRARLCLSDDAEISVEANPETVGYEELTQLKACGFNRVSFGVQSFDNAILRKIGRLHSAERAKAAFMSARRAGFSNISLDLMFALPGQTLEGFIRTLKTAADLSPEHISCYSLTLEEGSSMYKDKSLVFPDEETDRAMYAAAVSILKERGYEHYEISNFALPGKSSRHNTVYWRGGDYAGFGLGAHSLVGGQRFHNTYSLNEYLNGGYDKEDIETLSENDRMSEFMFLGLRMVNGINCEDFYRLFAKDIYTVFGRDIKQLISQGLLTGDRERLRLSEKGLDLSNYVFSNFI